MATASSSPNPTKTLDRWADLTALIERSDALLAANLDIRMTYAETIDEAQRKFIRIRNA